MPPSPLVSLIMERLISVYREHPLGRKMFLISTVVFTVHKRHLHLGGLLYRANGGKHLLRTERERVCLNDEKPHSCLALVNLSSILFDGESD